LRIDYEHAASAELGKEVLKIPEQQIVTTPSAVLTPQLGQQIKQLWKDGGVQKCYQQRSKFQLNDSASYYLDAIERIASPTYEVEELDILKSRTKTVGIVEEDFVIDKFKVCLIAINSLSSLKPLMLEDKETKDENGFIRTTKQYI
jgi:hypothetical protein